MGLQKLKELRESLKTSSRGKVIYFEDNTVTEVRLLPAQNGETPFKDVFVHYPSNKVVPKTVFSPKTWGDNDILEDYCNEKLNEGHKEENEFVFLINLKPKPVLIAPAIVRGQEERGVQLLSLNESQFESLIKAYERAFRGTEVKDIWDIDEGFDILFDVEKGEPYRSIEIDIARNPTPLQSDGVDEKTVVEWLENIPSWEEAYRKVTNEDLSKYLDNHLEGDDIDEDDDLAEYSKEEEYDVSDDIDDIEEETSDKIKSAMDKFRKQSESSGEESPKLEKNPFG